MMKSFTLRIFNFIKKIERFSDRIWFLPVMALFAALDLFVAFVPTDGIVITSVLLKPKRWIQTFIIMALGSAIGAWAMAFAVSQLDVDLTRFFSPKTIQALAESTQHHLGILGLAFIAAGPLPQQPPVAFCAISKMPLFNIFLAVFLGRALKYAFFSWCATHAPNIMRRFGLLPKEVSQLLPRT